MLWSAFIALFISAASASAAGCTALTAYNTPDNFCTGIPGLMIYGPLSASQQDCAASAWYNATLARSSNTSESMKRELQNVACKLWFPPCFNFTLGSVSHQTFMQVCQVTCERLANETGLVGSPLFPCDNSTFWVQQSGTGNNTACCVDPQLYMGIDGKFYYTDSQAGMPYSPCNPYSPTWTQPPLPDIGTPCSIVPASASTSGGNALASSLVLLLLIASLYL